MKSNSSKWQIWIDTGGTFTDCIAIDPKGKKNRIKVLSSGVLRGKILKRVRPGVFSFKARWNIRKDIFKGYRIHVPGSDPSPFSTIIKKIDFHFSDDQNHLLELDSSREISENQDFEISAGEEAPILAIRLATKTCLDEEIPEIELKLGSTKGTNALLEKKGAKVAFLVSRGFKDLLYIGTQQRPHLFQLDIPPKTVYQEISLEVQERINAQGEVLIPLEESEMKRIARELKNAGIENIAITLMHAYLNPEHEQKLQKYLLSEGFENLSISSVLAPVIKILPRANTTVINAYLAPIINTYFENISTKLGRQSFQVMTSAGGLIPIDNYYPKDSLLSGPAGGVNGAAKIARQLGRNRILTFDMGGTSTDTAMYNGGFDYRFFTQVGSAHLFSPALAIETVAAGGGSICAFDGFKLVVGPESAGANPGPASYGAGGPLTITDVNLLLGKIAPGSMPIPISYEAAHQALQQLLDKLPAFSPLDLLKGFETIANEKMADAIRRISISRGFDTRDFSLVVFGGAGGLHACKIAEVLSIHEVILPFEAGLLSAFGIGTANVEKILIRQILKPLHDLEDNFFEFIKKLDSEALDLIINYSKSRDDIEIRKRLFYLRFSGQDSTLEVELPELDHSIVPDLRKAFQQKYEDLFGHWTDTQKIELESIKIIVCTKQQEETYFNDTFQKYHPEAMEQVVPPYSKDTVYPVYDWNSLNPGAIIYGPAILKNAYSTAFLDAGWEAAFYPNKDAILKYREKAGESLSNKQEEIELELFTNRFTAIAEEMGAQLQRTAFSVNIKERLDFSCAILDQKAELLVNAPHIPVHLGSLGICARLILEKCALAPGDVLITNHPKYGGSHLPDVTLLSGVFNEKEELIAYVINRAHHAEIGGKQPGSMPPDAKCLAEEGVVIAPSYLVKNNSPQWEVIETLFTKGKYPTRSFHENLADIKAALAALRTGANALQKLEKQFGLAKLHYYMEAIKNIAASTLKKAIQRFGNQTFTARERLDDGHQLCTKIDISKDRLTFDFTGTAKVHPHNLNANISIVYSVIIYVLRLLCQKEIPLNEGLMQKVRIILPICLLNPDFADDPEKAPAVVGGNTEVSQRLTDTLLKALGLAACSQGTMNNFLFGNMHFGYYETIAGGCGAGMNFIGASAVHQHMTNTKITDPEELELRYPVRLEQFAIRRGSGGQGKFNGGDGIIRSFHFLESLSVTILSQHRVVAPYGIDGGKPGALGKQVLKRKNGAIIELKGLDQFRVESGDQLTIYTPGGGGFGRK